MTKETYIPGDLLVNDYPVAAVPVTIASGENLLRGAVIGKVTSDGKFKQSVAAAIDGSETPKFVLAIKADASAGDVEAMAYASGAFDSSKLLFGAGIDAAATEAAFRDADAPMFVKTLA